jgi:hypothetical protein
MGSCGEGAEDLYFVTTGNIAADMSVAVNSRLWRLRFDDLDDPLAVAPSTFFVR